MPTHFDDHALSQWLQANPNAIYGKDYVLIDIREQEEYDCQHIPGSHHVPCSTMPTDIDIPKNTTAFVYCAAGGRSRRFSDMIMAWGFAETYGLDGGMHQWLRCQTTACQHDTNKTKN